MPLAKPKMTSEDYWALPEGERAELIDGELWDLAAPSRVHQEIVAVMTTGLRNFISEHGGSCKAYSAPFAVDLFADDSTIVEPDVSVICDHDKLTDKGCTGAPDLVIEVVSPSSRGMDYGTKQNLYREAGVREYWIIDPDKLRTTVTRFEDDPAPLVYPSTTPVGVGIFPGLEFCLSDMLGG